MEKDHKDLIDKNYMLFTELLRLKSIPLIRYLFDEQVLTEAQATKTMSQAAHTLRAMHLLDNMLEMAPEAFNSLYAAILYTKLWRAADILEPKKRPHKSIMEEPHIPLPETWPDEAYFKELEGNQLKIEKVDENDTRMEEWYEQSSKNNIYEMKGTTKGRALIINNLNFDKQKRRSGSDKDVDGLKKIFMDLGFDVQAEADLKAEEMQKLLDQECRRDHSNFKCFFLILMSHGAEGVVYGKDGYLDPRTNSPCNCLNIENIKNQFYKVKSLERKPKVFIIQACQGSGRDPGLKERKADEEEDEEDIEDETPAEPNQPNHGDQANNEDKTAPDGKEAVTEEDNEGSELGAAGASDNEGDDDEDEEEDPRPHIREENADSITAEAPFHFLVAMATTEGNLSFRNTEHGSWFIQAFIYIVTKYAKKEDLLTLMEKINELVRRAKTEKTKRVRKHYVQVSQIRTTFTKRFFFFPGMPLAKSKPQAPIPPLSRGI